MAVDEHTRRVLYQRLEDVLGLEAATALMEHLPPVGWADVATKRDVDGLAAATKRDIDTLSTKMDATADRLRAEFRAELGDGISSQTRTLMIGFVGVNATTLAMAVALARLL